MERRGDAPVEQPEQESCRCPFCENAVVMPYPFCQACGAEIRYCPRCRQPLARDAQVCSHCGEPL